MAVYFIVLTFVAAMDTSEPHFILHSVLDVELHTTLKKGLDSDDEGYEGPLKLEMDETALEDTLEVIQGEVQEPSTYANDKQIPNKTRSTRNPKQSLENKTTTRLKRGMKALPYHHSNTSPRLRPGKVALPKRQGDDRLHRLCPICSKRQLSTNLTRHLRSTHGVHDLKQLSSLSIQASLDMRSGPRKIYFDDLPKLLKETWINKETRIETFRFFKKYQLYLAQDEDD